MLSYLANNVIQLSMARAKARDEPQLRGTAMTVVRRKCQFTGTDEEMDLPLTQQELDEGLARSWSWSRQFGGSGTEHMQNIFPQLNADQTEFLMTGTTPAIWNTMFPEGEDEDA